MKTFPKDITYLLPDDDVVLKNRINKTARFYGVEVNEAETAIDFLVSSSDILIVDRTCAMPDEWSLYLDYVEESHQKMGVDFYLDFPELAGEPDEDLTPLIIVDNLPQLVSDNIYPEPNKPKHTIYYNPYWKPDEIEQTIESLLDNKDSGNI